MKKLLQYSSYSVFRYLLRLDLLYRKLIAPLCPCSVRTVTVYVSCASLLVLGIGCAATLKDQSDDVRIVHLTRPDTSNVADPDFNPQLNDPTISGNAIVGRAKLDTNPIARIETLDGYAPQTPSSFENNQPIANQQQPSANLTPSAPHIVVEVGDTVYSLARRHNTTVAELAEVNRLDSDYAIYPGQVLFLSQQPTSSGSDTNLSNTAEKTSEPATTAEDIDTQSALSVTPTVITDLASRNKESITWSWPVAGTPRILRAFSNASGETIKGIDIAGEADSPVYASADGTVVYAGSELKGYGNLVIISHPSGFMSAYAHNNRLLVEADQVIQRGQHIADFGQTESNRVKLFFQIRKNGEPVDPIIYLPQR